MTDAPRTRSRRPGRWLGAVAWLVPSGDRSAWRREWDGELAYFSKMAAAAHRPLGRWWLARRLTAALQHALWLRGQTMNLRDTGRDTRQAMRVLARRPGFTIASVLTLGIGIGGATVIFSVMQAVFWRPLPYPDPDGLVIVSTTTAARPHGAVPNSVSPADFFDWREQSTAFSALAAVRDDGYALQEEGGAEQITGTAVTPSFFAVFGVAPEVGRTLVDADGEAGASPVVVLSHALWQRRYGGQRDVVGRSIVLDGQAREVVGVMPKAMNFPLGSEAWTPLVLTTDDVTRQRGAHYLSVVGRMRPGALPVARAEVAAIAERLAAQYPRTNGGSRVSVAPLRAGIVGDAVAPGMRLLLGAVGLVFLVACVNVSSLVLGMSIGRGRDFAVRAALGASRFRLVRGLFVESVLLAGAGGVAGLMLAVFGTRLIASLETTGIALLDEARVDATVVIFAGVATLAAACVFGLLPAVRASRDLNGALAGGTRTTHDRARVRARSALVAVEIALAVVLLVAAGVLGRSFLTLVRTPLGIDPGGVHTVSLSLPAATYKDLDRRALFVERVLANVAQRSDVEAAGAIFGLPLTDFTYSISGHQRDAEALSPDDQGRLSLNVRVVSPVFFRALGVPIVAGRDFAPSDRRGAAPVAILNEGAARLYFPGAGAAAAVGHRVVVGTRLGLGGERVGGEIVGIAGDVRDVGPGRPARPTIYVAHAQFPMGFLTLVVRAPGARDDLSRALRSAVADVDPAVPVFRERTMEQFASRIVAQPRLYLTLLAVFAGAATALAAIGIFGVMAQNVVARSREIGVRMALGASRQDVVTMIIRSAGRLTVIGVAAGFSLAVLARPAIGRAIVGVSPADGLTYLAVGLMTLGIALAAAWVPARRAAKVDPVGSLRAE